MGGGGVAENRANYGGPFFCQCRLFLYLYGTLKKIDGAHYQMENTVFLVDPSRTRTMSFTESFGDHHRHFIWGPINNIL